MPVYAWEGRTRQGTLKKGVIEASSEAAATLRLRGQMISPVSVRAKASRGLGTSRCSRRESRRGTSSCSRVSSRR